MQVVYLGKDREEEEVLEETKLSVTEMLIAVSIKKPEKSSELSDAFGRSEFFSIYDSINDISEVIQNPYSSELGGAGIQSARFLIEKKIEVVITNFIGLNTLRFFNSLKVNDQEEIRLMAPLAAGTIERVFADRLERVRSLVAPADR